MANKKIFMSVTATAFIASAFLGAEEAEAASYKVQSGDSLWVIAQKFDTSVSQLKSINNLTSDVIFPNQVLETEKKSTTSKNSSSNSSTSSSNSTSTSTYTVKSGDTLSGIASKYKISLSDLMKWNNLNSTLIYPGNKLVVSKTTATEQKSNSSTEKKTSEKPAEKVGSSVVYTVKSGDSLSRIASEHKVTVAQIKNWNNLKSDLILIGQKLNIGSSTPATSTPKDQAPASTDVSYNVDSLVKVAKNQVGASYAWGGTTPSGFDCSGFIYYAYKQAGMDIKRYSSEGYYSRSYYVNTPKIGDLVFFEGTYKAGISHVGIYIGNNEFIHASSGGVQVTSLNNSYWKKHFEGFKRFY
ncbi:LysM peptidoglycan-binding domain-containing protein [Ornithinibacillus sp. L9]|uniref:LysM peptidoglycan-binding domain-containing protein n=1 Tax=Ornithinibacillus caprae TaxID=2678566 RepID=A0A6N8FDX3_9BACI|nr:peptidoglycan endopeptidase [Ornithinibacillus caprae]MUK87401.1 LysM peptidoglycan-binding domain-containing protein [Ornithinibacillus caprae]